MTMENPQQGALAPPPTEDEIADNISLQRRAFHMSQTLNNQMKGLGILSEADMVDRQRQLGIRCHAK